MFNRCKFLTLLVCGALSEGPLLGVVDPSSSCLSLSSEVDFTDTDVDDICMVAVRISGEYSMVCGGSNLSGVASLKGSVHNLDTMSKRLRRSCRFPSKEKLKLGTKNKF